MAISEFRAKCLEVVGDVQRTGNPILITQQGAPAAVILPAFMLGRPSELSNYLAAGRVPRIVCPPREEWDLVS